MTTMTTTMIVHSVVPNDEGASGGGTGAGVVVCAKTVNNWFMGRGLPISWRP